MILHPRISMRHLKSFSMANCLVLQEKKEIKIMKMDGEIIKYQSPLKVQQVLNEFPGHAISDALPVIRYLDSMACLRHGQLYYLLPPKTPAAATGEGTGFVRIKLVLTRQELKEMLRKGEFSHGDMVSLLKREHGRIGASDRKRCMEWRPTLESIPEVNDFC